MRPSRFLISLILAATALVGVVACGGGSGSDSGTSAVTAPTITAQPGSQTVASGSTATLSVTAAGSGTLTYQWYLGTSAITGATASSYTTGTAGSYSVVVSNSAGSVTSSTATVTVAAATAPSITTQPASVTVSSGATGTFTVVAAGTDLTYQWYSTSGAMAGATSASYSTGTAGSYYVVVTNSSGSVTSNTVTLSIGASGTTVASAAQAFVATLSSSQQSSAVLGCTASVAKNWSNLPISLSSRNGIQLSTLSSTQLAAANALLAAAFSSSGVALIEQIRLGDEYIHLTNTSQNWGYSLYKLALLCTPSASSTWMLQVTGHHLGYTLTFNGTTASATPVFIGTEPPNWTSGGTTYAPLDTQRAAIQALALSLQADSSRAATAKLSGTFTDVTMGPSGSGDSNYPLTYPTGTAGRGIAYSALTTAQQAQVRAVIEAYANTVSSDLASTLLAAYESDSALASTYVGYGVNGSTGTASFVASPSGLTTQNSYFRIDGPRVWIEFVVQQGVAFNTQVHYHSVWRDKTADYGAQF